MDQFVNKLLSFLIFFAAGALATESQLYTGRFPAVKELENIARQEGVYWGSLGRYVIEKEPVTFSADHGCMVTSTVSPRATYLSLPMKHALTMEAAIGLVRKTGNVGILNGGHDWLFFDKVLIPHTVLNKLLNEVEGEELSVGAPALVGWLYEMKAKTNSVEDIFRKLGVAKRNTHRLSYYISAAKRAARVLVDPSWTNILGLDRFNDGLVDRGLWELNSLLFKDQSQPFSFASVGKNHALRFGDESDAHRLDFESKIAMKIYQIILYRLLIADHVQLADNTGRIWIFRGIEFDIIELIDAKLKEHQQQPFWRRILATEEEDHLATAILERMSERSTCNRRLTVENQE